MDDSSIESGWAESIPAQIGDLEKIDTQRINRSAIEAFQVRWTVHVDSRVMSIRPERRRLRPGQVPRFPLGQWVDHGRVAAPPNAFWPLCDPDILRCSPSTIALLCPPSTLSAPSSLVVLPPAPPAPPAPPE